MKFDNNTPGNLHHCLLCGQTIAQYGSIEIVRSHSGAKHWAVHEKCGFKSRLEPIATT